VVQLEEHLNLESSPHRVAAVAVELKIAALLIQMRPQQFVAAVAVPADRILEAAEFPLESVHFQVEALLM